MSRFSRKQSGSKDEDRFVSMFPHSSDYLFIKTTIPCFSQVRLFAGSVQIMDTLAEIQERHDAVRDLEKKLLDLQQVNLNLVYQKLSRIQFDSSLILLFYVSG